MITISGPGRKYENDIIEQRSAAPTAKTTYRPDCCLRCRIDTAECGGPAYCAAKVKTFKPPSGGGCAGRAILANINRTNGIASSNDSNRSKQF
ncbi:hypothetical protein QTP88_008979 [Uroleucon formosanum]